MGNPVPHLSLLRRKRRHKVKPPKREKMDGLCERKRKKESKLRTKRERHNMENAFFTQIVKLVFK